MKTNQKHQVKQYQFLAWKSGGVVPESIQAFIELVSVVFEYNKLVQNNIKKIDHHNNSVLVHCSGGGDRSSVFVTFVSLLEQLASEKRVDIFQTARFIRSQRQGMLQSEVKAFLIE